jgi:hypothetical protein
MLLWPMGTACAARDAAVRTARVNNNAKPAVVAVALSKISMLLSSGICFLSTYAFPLVGGTISLDPINLRKAETTGRAIFLAILVVIST